MVLQDSLTFCRDGIQAPESTDVNAAATQYLDHAINMLKQLVRRLLADNGESIADSYASELSLVSTSQPEDAATESLRYSSSASTSSSACSSPSTSAPPSASSSSGPSSPGSDSSCASNAPTKQTRGPNYKGATLELLENAAVEHRQQRSIHGKLGPYLT
jgi:hypothetical protein